MRCRETGYGDDWDLDLYADDEPDFDAAIALDDALDLRDGADSELELYASRRERAA